jgi:hypothetical protein
VNRANAVCAAVLFGSPGTRTARRSVGAQVCASPGPDCGRSGKRAAPCFWGAVPGPCIGFGSLTGLAGCQRLERRFSRIFACPRGCRWWSDFRADGSLRERSSGVEPGGHPRICPSRGRFEGAIQAGRMQWLALQGWYPSPGRPGIGAGRGSRRVVLRLSPATGLWTGFDLVPQKSLLPGAGRAGCPLRQNGCYPVDPHFGNQGSQRPQALGPTLLPLGGTVFLTPVSGSFKPATSAALRSPSSAAQCPEPVVNG